MAVKHHPYLRNSVYLLCHLLTSTIRSSSIALTSAMQSVASGWQWQYGRPPGVRLRNCQCVDAGFIKHTPMWMEDFVVTCQLVPGVPHLISGSCTSPRIFGLGFLQTPPRDDALALLLTLGSANTWYRDFHPASHMPCLAHTVVISCGDSALALSPSA